VKRILQEVKEIQRDVEAKLSELETETGGIGGAGDGDGGDGDREKGPSTADVNLVAEALEDNIFEWHFAIRGQRGSDYEGGVYHGRILLPPEYPFKPPDFVMLTPSGRFEVGKRICLSISQHHPEHWQPSWSVRTALTALVAFMPTPGEGALGSLDYTKEEKKTLATKSREKAPAFGNAERQEVSNRIHMKMLKLMSPDFPDLPLGIIDSVAEQKKNEAGAAAGGEGSSSGQNQLDKVRRQANETRGNVTSTLLSTLFYILLALATCAILRNALL